MKPSQVASYLRYIASKIEASKRPDPKLVSQDLNRVINRIATSKPSKPSEMNNKHNSEYMAYYDANSTEYPIVVFCNDVWTNEMLIISFTSKNEFNEWCGKEEDGTWGEGALNAGPDPENAESIDPDDADELASTPGMKLFEHDDL
jgi:hypothetical protein